MKKPVTLAALAVVFAVAAFMLLPMRSEPAAAQAGGVYINAVDLDIVPAEFDKYVAAIKENGAAAVKEPGCREFIIMVSAKDAHHVFLFEVYDSAAALDAHRATDHFKKYAAATANMVSKREVRGMTPIAMNYKAK